MTSKNSSTQMQTLLALYKEEDQEFLKELEGDLEELEKILSLELPGYEVDLLLFLMGVPDNLWIK